MNLTNFMCQFKRNKIYFKLLLYELNSGFYYLSIYAKILIFRSKLKKELEVNI